MKAFVLQYFYSLGQRKSCTSNFAQQTDLNHDFFVIEASNRNDRSYILAHAQYSWFAVGFSQLLLLVLQILDLFLQLGDVLEDSRHRRRNAQLLLQHENQKRIRISC